MKTVRFALSAALVTLLLAGCGAAKQGDGGSSKPDIRGTIAFLQGPDEQAKGAGILGSLLIEGVKEPDTQYDRASVKVTEETRILERRQVGSQEVGFDALRVNRLVEAKFTGPVAESYPVQATAGEIVIIR